MKSYVVGFLFRSDLKSVALIRKNRPEWQAGYLNGIGGKLEDYEFPKNAMVREFREETGCEANISWKFFMETSWKEGTIFYYCAVDDNAQLKSVTDEEVDWVNVEDLPKLKVIANLSWAIPLAIQYFHEPFMADVKYGVDPLTRRIKEFQK